MEPNICMNHIAALYKAIPSDSLSLCFAALLLLQLVTPLFIAVQTVTSLDIVVRMYFGLYSTTCNL